MVRYLFYTIGDLTYQTPLLSYDQLSGYQIFKECMSWYWIRFELVDIVSVKPDDIT